jgi:hypothetical protein
MPPKTQEQLDKRTENSRNWSLKKREEQKVLDNKLVDVEAKLAKYGDFGPNSTIYPHDPTKAYTGLAADLRRECR